MGRVVYYALYAVILIQFLGGLIAFYRIDPKILFSALSLQTGFFLGLFLLIHALGLVGAVLAAFRLRWGFLLSIAHHLLMALGIKVASTFTFLTHDVISFFVFFLSRFDEYSVTFRWSWGLGTVFSQLARDPRGIYIGVNLIAVASAAYLWWAMKEAQAEAEEAQRMRRPQRRPARQAPMDERQQRRAG
jgi:hypothetical protein